MSGQVQGTVPLVSAQSDSSPSPPPSQSRGISSGTKKLLMLGGGLVVVVVVLVSVLVTAPWENDSSSSSDAAGTSGVQVPTTPEPTPTTPPGNGNSVDSCSDIYMYSSLVNNILDGTLDNFMFGPKSNNTDCCSTLGCVSATVTTYECVNEDGRPPSLLYELQCCEKSNQRDCFGAPISMIVEASSLETTSTLGATLNDDPNKFMGCAFREVTKDVNCNPLDVGSNKNYDNIKYIPSGETDSTEGPTTEEPTTEEPTTEETTEESTTEESTTEEPTTEEPTTEEPTTEEPTEEPKECLLPPNNELPCEVCTQDNEVESLPGVKEGGCLQVICMPTSIPVGATFHTRVRWCLQRPRRYNVNFDLLDLGYGKDFFVNDEVKNDPTVADNPAYPYTLEEFPLGYLQCGEHTFELNLDIEPTKYPPGEDPPADAPMYNVMWKFFIAPRWGGGADGVGELHDPFPNMLSESGVPAQPIYTDGGEVVNDGNGNMVKESTVYWNLPPTGKQDAIHFPEFPPCIPRGFDGFQGYTFEVWTHLESMDVANLHVNLMRGTGGDAYLGEADEYIADSPDPIDEGGVFAPILKNQVTEYYEDGYWNVHTITFSQAKLQKVVEWAVENGEWPNTYFTAFLVPDGDHFEERDENGDFILDDEGNIIYTPKLNYEDDGVTPKVDCRYPDPATGTGCIPVTGYDMREIEHLFQVELCDDPRKIAGFLPQCEYPIDCEGGLV